MSGLLVLVIDDDEQIRDSIKEILELENCSVLTASNGKNGLEILKNQKRKPHFILLDMMMPIMNGREFLDILLSNPELSSIPVYFISANARPDQTHGSRGVIKKPMDYSSILKLIQEHMAELQ